MARGILATIMAWIAITVADPNLATNAPCSGSKGGIAYCQENLFVCENGSTSRSQQDCRTYQGGIHNAGPSAVRRSGPVTRISEPAEANSPPLTAQPLLSTPAASGSDLIATPAPSPDVTPLTGRASVVDGDTIEIHGTRIRLEGIDAPESRQTCADKASGEVIRCGQKAAFFLADMLAEHTVACTEDGKDRYGRSLAHCDVQGQDVGAALIRAGWALAFVRYSREYLPQEAEARAAGAGMWATEFVAPWDWRKGTR